jgi:hypothetical protein
VTKWHFTEQSHLAIPGLMQDLAGLGIVRQIFLLCLMRGQVGEDAAGELRIGP